MQLDDRNDLHTEYQPPIFTIPDEVLGIIACMVSNHQMSNRWDYYTALMICHTFRKIFWKHCTEEFISNFGFPRHTIELLPTAYPYIKEFWWTSHRYSSYNADLSAKLSIIQKITNLRQLTLAHQHNIEANYSNLTNLTELSIYNTNFINIQLPISLRSILINHPKLINISDISHLTNLTDLHIVNDALKGRDLVVLTQLRELYVSKCRNVLSKHISKLTHLEILSLKDAYSITSHAYSRLTNLRELNIDTTDITPCVQMTNLQKLTIYKYNKDTNLTDELIADLKRNIKEVVVTGDFKLIAG